MTAPLVRVTAVLSLSPVASLVMLLLMMTLSRVSVVIGWVLRSATIRGGAVALFGDAHVPDRHHLPIDQD